MANQFTNTKKILFLHGAQTLSVTPNTSVIIQCTFSTESFPEGTVAILEPNPRFGKQTGLCVTSAIVKFDAKKQVAVGILNLLPHQVTVKKNAQVAKVTILTSFQAQYLQPVNSEILSDHFHKSINCLIADSEHTVYPSNDEFWFPTPENCLNPETFTGIQKRIYDEIVALKKREKLNLAKNLADRETFLAQFLWENSVFNQEQKQQIESLLLKYHQIFA